MKKNSSTLKNILTLNCAVKKNSFEIDFLNSKYLLAYPPKILSVLPPNAQKILFSNFLYSRAAPLPLVIASRLRFQTPRPYLKKFADFGVIGDLPRVSDKKNLSLAKLLARFNQSIKNRQVIFQKPTPNEKILPKNPSQDSSALLAISFGKDSLLSYGLAREIGLDCHLVFNNEMESQTSREYFFKKQIIKNFSCEEKQKIEFLSENIDEIFYDKKIKNNIDELENTNGMLAFALELLPFAYFHRSRYLIFGNEQNLNDYYCRAGRKTYPSFDQSSAYAKKLNYYLKNLTTGNLQVISLVEPIYNLAEMRLLYRRYPHLLKYLMSCSPAKSDPDKWCHRCPMCAKAFLYSAAIGGDPKKIGFKKDLFEKKYQELYPLFAKKITRPYEKPPQVKAEQLLAFLLAYRSGWRGSLIELFKQKYLGPAIRQEKSLRQKFFGLHPAPNLPPHLQSRLLPIFKQELKNLV